MNKKQFLGISFIVMFNVAQVVNVCFAEKEHSIDKFQEECMNKDSSTYGMADCLVEATAKWDVEMNKYYNLLMRLLKEDAKIRLKESQRAWIKFRDAEIETIKYLYSYSGTKYKLDRASDVKDITEKRALKLKEYYEAVELEQVSAIELTKDDIQCIKTMRGDFDGDGSIDTATLMFKKSKTYEDMINYGLEVKSIGKTFIINRVADENDILFGLEKIVVSPKIAPFIGILYHTGAYSWGLELYDFDGKTIRKVEEFGSDGQSIQVKDADKDGENEIVITNRDWNHNSVEDRTFDTFKYNGKEWKLISIYETKTKKFIPIVKKE